MSGFLPGTLYLSGGRGVEMHVVVGSSFFLHRGAGLVHVSQLILSTVNGHLGYFQFLETMNNAAVNSLVGLLVNVFLRHTPRIGNAGFWDVSVGLVFRSGRTDFHSSQQEMRCRCSAATPALRNVLSLHFSHSGGVCNGIVPWSYFVAELLFQFVFLW